MGKLYSQFEIRYPTGQIVFCFFSNAWSELRSIRLLQLNYVDFCQLVSANGYTRAEAVVVLFLQKRKNARRVYAHVVHAKTNCDGLKDEGFHHPSVAVQTNLLQEFYEECQVDPNQLVFLEAHATGTKVS